MSSVFSRCCMMHAYTHVIMDEANVSFTDYLCQCKRNRKFSNNLWPNLSVNGPEFWPVNSERFPLQPNNLNHVNKLKGPYAICIDPAHIQAHCQSRLHTTRDDRSAAGGGKKAAPAPARNSRKTKPWWSGSGWRGSGAGTALSTA